MKSKEIRSRFLEFFANRDHRVVRSSSLVPANDPTLLFSNAGMNQFKDVFLGREKRDYARACSSQKCVRAGGKHNDLEQVGRTTRHHTFFEMLGNFSFGDYFKKEAIPWAWELVTKDFGIPAAKLYATVFREDDEAEEIWAKIIPRERIFRRDEVDNFWAMGETGPCGPCSEIHYDLGPAASDLSHKDCAFPCDCGRYTEIWNLVFMQFNRDEQGKTTPLPRPSIDTGAGLERFATVLQGKTSNFDTDLFRPLIEEAAELANVEYGANHDTDVSLRIIADHSRAAAFLISDGVLPSNEGRGYVLRLILRRALYHGQTLGLNEPFMFKLAAQVVEMMKDAYPELVEHEHHVAKAIKIEEEKYAHTTRIGLERLEEDLATPHQKMLKVSQEIQKLLVPSRKLVKAAEALQKVSSPGTELIKAVEAVQRVLTPTRELVKAAEALQKASSPSPELLKAVKVVEEMLKPSRKLVEAAEALQKVSSPSPEFVVSVEASKDMAALSEEILQLVEEGRLKGYQVFKLHDTYGLRPDFVLDIARNRGVPVDITGYEAEMEKQRERARASWKAAEKKVASPLYLELAEKHATKFDGYDQATSAAREIIALVQEGMQVSGVKAGAEVGIIFDRTPFYAEGGGQVGDTGRFLDIRSLQEVGQVHDTYFPVTGLIVHKATARESLRVGDWVIPAVDAERRNAIRRNHTATHLLHAALRRTLGTHVKQAGSLVAPDRLRFDFTHYAALDEQDLLDIEDLVNQHILANEAVVTEQMELDAAVNSGAMALFGEKYADRVRVVSVSDFSKELCGGTHVSRTGDIGLFKVIAEGSVAAGTRRIEAFTGEGVLAYLRQASETLTHLAQVLRGRPEEAYEAVLKLVESEKKLRKELEAQQMKRAISQVGDLVEQAKQVKGVRVISARVEAMDRAAMRQMIDSLRPKLKSGVIVLGTNTADGNVALIAAVTKDLTNRLDASKIVRQAAALVDGSGGGRKDLAEAGGKNPQKLDESLQAIPSIVEKML